MNSLLNVRHERPELLKRIRRHDRGVYPSEIQQRFYVLRRTACYDGEDMQILAVVDNAGDFGGEPDGRALHLPTRQTHCPGVQRFHRRSGRRLSH